MLQINILLFAGSAYQILLMFNCTVGDRFYMSAAAARFFSLQEYRFASISWRPLGFTIFIQLHSNLISFICRCLLHHPESKRHMWTTMFGHDFNSKMKHGQTEEPRMKKGKIFTISVFRNKKKKKKTNSTLHGFALQLLLLAVCVVWCIQMKTFVEWLSLFSHFHS